VEEVGVNPLVSIIIPVYNGANYLEKAIDSALSQKYSNFEVIVVNDGSNDGNLTSTISKKYGSKIRYFEKNNGGVSSALNLGISVMKGKYFSWLSHDDIYLPNKLSKQVSFAEKFNSDFVYSDYTFIDNHGEKLDILNDVNKDLTKDIRLRLIQFYPIHGCSALINRQIFDQIGEFNENLETTQDYDMWFRISLFYKMDFLNEKVLFSRLHAAQDSNIKPHRFLEGDVLYSEMLRKMILSNQYSDLDFYESFKSLLNRNFYSSAAMACRGINTFRLKVKAGLYLFYYLLKLISNKFLK
jgi:glycosyltransferase involved in cell wall biosynthesis